MILHRGRDVDPPRVFALGSIAEECLLTPNIGFEVPPYGSVATWLSGLIWKQDGQAEM
jgi:hypothetical protein